MNLQIFNNSQFGEIRIATTENNEPMFCLADLCKILEIRTNDVQKRLNAKGCDTIVTPTKGGKQSLIFINEQNFYKAVFQSRKPEAEVFTDWVAGEVLPSIRKHGAYMTPEKLEEALTNPDTLIQLATNLKTEQAKRREAESRVEQLRATSKLQELELKASAPKVTYYEDVMNSSTLIATNIIAKELGITAIKLNRILHKKDIIYKSAGVWLLYSRYQGKGYTKTKTHHYKDSHDNDRTSIQTYWTEKGREFIHSVVTESVISAV